MPMCWAEKYQMVHGDCLDVLKTLPDCSVDAVVTDPPYGLSFMGKRWDYDVPSEAVWAECLRVLKPGGHLLAFAGTRTQHRMAARIEDAGFEIRDMIAWVYGSGFPKSLDVSKAIDKAAGAEREVVGYQDIARRNKPENLEQRRDGLGSMCGKGAVRAREEAAAITAPATEAAKEWQGWGTALKPAMEPITVARKPLTGTVAENVLAHGTGALNIDGCRVAGRERTEYGLANSKRSAGNTYGEPSATADFDASKGRWPANLIHDGSDEVVKLFPSEGRSTKPSASGRSTNNKGAALTGMGGVDTNPCYGDKGSAARFFYTAKASKADRDEGLYASPDAVLARSCQAIAESKRGNTVASSDGAFNKARIVKNNHPTVKPTDLMRYLCRLVTPPGGIVLDPFMGSGSTGKAAILEGFRFIGIEREAEYLEIARRRIALVDPEQFELAPQRAGAA